MRTLVLIGLGSLLCSCSMTTPSYTPSPTPTGHWEGSIRKYTFSFKVSADLELTNSPNPGDLSGTVNIEGMGSGVIKGNVKTGVLEASNASTSITCQGEFKENAFYAANCAADGVSGSLTMYRQSK